MHKSSNVSLAHLLPFLLLFFSGCRTGYVLDQGSEFLHLMSQREPVDRILSSGNLSDEQEQKLRIIRKVRSFADEEVRLDVGDAYTTYVQLDREAVSWAITGTQELRTAPLTWSFPVVGTFPYIGFFRKSEANEYREQLLLDGYDVEMRPVNAFSTLGWFSDPVLSPMLNSKEPLLIHTVLHELVHRTIFITGRTSLNEAIATEVGQIATLRYLRTTHASSADIVRDTKQYFDDLSLVQQFFLDLRNRLNQVYGRDRPPDWKRRRKKRVIMHARRAYVGLLDRLNTPGWERLLSSRWNNAFVASKAVYYQHTKLIHRLWKDAFQKNLRRTVAFLKTLDSDRPIQRIRERIDQADTDSASPSSSPTASR